MTLRKLVMLAIIRFVRLERLIHWSERVNNLLRIKFGEELRQVSGGEILSGPLQGLQLPASKRSSWSLSSDHVSMVMGEYESALIEELVKNGPYDGLVDIGSSWGLYVFGLPHCGVVKGPVIAFELNEDDQAYINERARAEAMPVLVRGGATTEEVRSFLSSSPSKRGLVICDVEGFEYDLWTEEVVRQSNGWFFAIELHDCSRDADLLKVFEQTHDSMIISHFQKPLSPKAVSLVNNFRPTLSLRDFTVASLLADGRRSGQQWLFASPKRLDGRVASPHSMGD
jgi:hypothetical protein